MQFLLLTLNYPLILCYDRVNKTKKERLQNEDRKLKDLVMVA